MSQSTVELPGAQGPPALIPRGRNGRCLRFPIGFLFAEDPIRRFGQMPGHGPDGLRVALAPGYAVIEATHMAVRRAPAPDADRVRGFDERPFEIAVDVRAGRTEAGLAAARVDARRGPRIGGQLLGGAKPRDVAHLEGDHDGEREPHPRQVRSRWMAGVGVNTAWIRCSNARTWRSRFSTCSRSCWLAYAVCGGRRANRWRRRARPRTPKTSLTSKS